MKKYILDVLIKPFFAIAFFLGFGGFFVFGGFQSVTVDLERAAGHAINGELTRKHFLGLYTVTTSLEGVTEARIDSRWGSARTVRPFPVAVSGVILEAGSGAVPIFWGFSNVDEKNKLRIMNELNEYIESGKAGPLSKKYTIRNVFGWFGLPFFIIGALGMVGWPKVMVSGWRKRKDMAPTAAA